jgi:hypothetical protein
MGFLPQIVLVLVLVIIIVFSCMAKVGRGSVQAWVFRLASTSTSSLRMSRPKRSACTRRFLGGYAVGQANAESPGSDGASPYLRQSCSCSLSSSLCWW